MQVEQWYVNPFRFLEMVLRGGYEPKPDITTLNGRRIFYSHIDGDGWNNLSEIKKYRKHKTISADVIYKEVLQAFPEIPVSVSIISSEMDEKCYGLSVSADIARKIFALPNVEPTSHTHSHPLFWHYLETMQPELEAQFLHKYPKKPERKGLYSMVFGKKTESSWHEHKEHGHEGEFFERVLSPDARGELFKNQYYETPRSYACEPYDLEQEIVGSIEVVNSLSPEHKKARLMQWSGDTSPYEEVLRVTREAGYLNINGGDSRFDNEYPSYTSVSPVGLRVGDEIQIYSSNSNENTYTNLWTDRFYGFLYLQHTVKNTENPIRVQPFNIYYHMYSGEKQASLNALLANIRFAQQQPTIDIFASDFAAIANGFFSARFESEGDGAWRVRDRGALQTLRFDIPEAVVDMNRSEGVTGYSYHGGSMYVSLDEDTEEPLVVVKQLQANTVPEKSETPILIESSWRIKDLQNVKNSLMFTASGFGKGEFSFRFPSLGEHRLNVVRDENVIVDRAIRPNEDGVLAFTLDVSGVTPVDVVITK